MTRSEITLAKGIYYSLNSEFLIEPGNGYKIIGECDDYLRREDLPDDLRTKFQELRDRASSRGRPNRPIGAAGPAPQ